MCRTCMQSGQVQALYMPRTFTDYVASFDCSLVVAEHEAFAAFWGAGVVTLADAPLVSLPSALPLLRGAPCMDSNSRCGN